MKDFKLIVEDDRKRFEEKIRNNLNEGYKMVNTNLSVFRPIQPTINAFTETKKELIFYAYMEKEA